MTPVERITAPSGERLSLDKIMSVASLIFGSRALQFNAFLEQAPTSAELTALANQTGATSVRDAIFDLDGTLVPPYAPVPDSVMTFLDDYLSDGRRVGIYTNSPHSKRLERLRMAGIQLPVTGLGKPSLEGFRRFCDAAEMNPSTTAMIGNFPVTDMPLPPEGAPPFFPLNILVRSIPPDRRLIASQMQYWRACLFHALSMATAKIVLRRNHRLIRNIG